MKSTFAQALELLRRNPIIVVPPLVIAIASSAVDYVLSSAGYTSWGYFGDLNAQGPSAFWMFFGTIAALGLRVLSALVAIAFTTGMAAAAWERGTAQLRDGLSAFEREGVQILTALVLLFVIGLVASALVLPTFGVSLLLYLIFAIYTMPAVVAGDRHAQDALLDSVRLAAANFGTTLLLVVLVIVLAIVGGGLGEAAGRIPLLGQVVSWTVMEVVVAYATLVVVGEYNRLSRS